MSRVLVSGIGIITALGKGVDAQLDALKNARTGLAPLKNLDSIYRNQLPAAEVEYNNRQLLEMISGNYDAHKNTRGQLLSLIAAEEAVNDAGLSQADMLEMPVITGNTVAGMDVTEKIYRNHQKSDSYFFNQAHSGGEIGSRLAAYFGSRALNTTINTACSSSSNALLLAARLIRSGKAKRVLAGGGDPLSKFSLNGFKSLMIYDDQPCRPFDSKRNGLNLGEGAAYLILESEESAKGKEVYGELLGYANRNEAFHASASSPDGQGAYLTMLDALRSAGLQAGDIDFVHAHGTATPNNDESELRALMRLFGDNLPPFASSKAYVGHTLGAAGVVNAVFSLLSLKHAFLFPNPNFENEMEKGIKPVTEFQPDTEINYCMSNAFGFGGNNTTLIFGKGGQGE